MPRVEVDINYSEWNLECNECGYNLTIHDDGGVEPCSNCLEISKDSGWHAGYDDGYDVGFERGKQEAYEERSDFNTLIRRGTTMTEEPRFLNDEGLINIINRR